MFLINQFLGGILGKSFDAKRLRTSEGLVVIDTNQQATSLLAQTRMADLDTTVTIVSMALTR